MNNQEIESDKQALLKEAFIEILESTNIGEAEWRYTKYILKT